VTRALRRAADAGRAASSGYVRHACSQFAAAIAYRVLFSLVPFVAFVVSIADLLLPSSLRDNVVDWLYDTIPGTDFEQAIDNSILHPGLDAPVVAIAAAAGLLWAATGMMASVRTAFRVIWEVEGLRFARGKLRDLLLVGLTTCLIFVAFGISLVTRVVVQFGGDVSNAVGIDSGGRVLGSVAEAAAALGVAFLAFLTLYLAVPPVRTSLRDVWPSALLAALAYGILSEGFGIYLARLADFSAVYGPLGAVFAFLLLVYLSGAILLFCAELAAGRARARHP